MAVQLLSGLAYAYWFTRPRPATLWAHLRGMNIGERFKPTLQLARTYAEHAPVMTLMGRFARGIRYALRSFAIREEFGDVWGQGQSHAYYGLVLYAAGRFRECAEACRKAVDLLERTGDFNQLHIAQFQLSCALYRFGDLSGAYEQARLHYESGNEVGDEQATGVSMDIWARATFGEVPKQILEIGIGSQSHRRAMHRPGPVRQRSPTLLCGQVERGGGVFCPSTSDRGSDGGAERLYAILSDLVADVPATTVGGDGASHRRAAQGTVGGGWSSGKGGPSIRDAISM